MDPYGDGEDHTPSLVEELKASGIGAVGSHMVKEGLSDSETLQWAHWQVTAFRLPLALHEASGCWDGPPWLTGLCPTYFMLHTGASGPRDIWAMRQEKTLALAQALQACTKESGVTTGILWELAQ